MEVDVPTIGGAANGDLTGRSPLQQVRITRKRARRKDPWPDEEQALAPAATSDDTVTATLDLIDEVLAET